MLLSSAVVAQSKQPTEADLALAKQYFQLGRTYYEQGLHEKALEAFQESYRHSGRPALLYNIARCYEFLGQVETAIEHYERFLGESGKENPTIRARIHNLQNRLARSRETRPTVSPPPVKPPPVKPTQPKPKPQAPLAPVAKPKPSAAPRSVGRESSPTPRAMISPVADGDTERPAEWMKWTGWGLIGVGAAALATSFVFAARAASKASLLEDAQSCATGQGPDDCPSPAGTAYDWSRVKSIDDDGKRFEVVQITTLVLGIVAGGAGVTLLLLRPQARPAQTARIAPMLGRDTIGLTSSVVF